MNRAAKRRALREAGQHRSKVKRGRRSAIRNVKTSNTPLSTLEAKGFVIATPKLHLPGEK